MEDTSRRSGWLGRLAAIIGLLVVTLAGGAFLLARADGPVFVFAGGPLRSGEQVDFAEMDWHALDELHELELEIVGAESSRTLWFSVHEASPTSPAISTASTGGSRVGPSRSNATPAW